MNLDVLEKHLVVFKAKDELRHAQGVSSTVDNVCMNLDMTKRYLVWFMIKGLRNTYSSIP